jgi:hypothetical protein
MFGPDGLKIKKIDVTKASLLNISSRSANTRHDQIFINHLTVLN